MTPEQSKQIAKILDDAWDRIYDEVVTPDQKDEKGTVKDIVFLFKLESMIQGFAANFGLAAFGHLGTKKGIWNERN